jgi:hypothetical protein
MPNLHVTVHGDPAIANLKHMASVVDRLAAHIPDRPSQ